VQQDSLNCVPTLILFDADKLNFFICQAFEEPPNLAGGAVGKEGLQEYISRGYFPNNNGDQVPSATMPVGKDCT
jgi:hypothetical protein